MKKDTNTKTALIEVAHKLFADRGYDGVSIADIAGELGITKQALLHHFGNKEKLYGKVLEGVSERLGEIIQAHENKSDTKREQFFSILHDLYEHMNTQKHDARLIMRELLENQPRIEDKQKWYLRPFLEKLTELIREITIKEQLSSEEGLTRTFQILGAINYFAISDPTLKKMFGKQTYSDVEQLFFNQLKLMYALDGQ